MEFITMLAVLAAVNLGVLYYGSSTLEDQIISEPRGTVEVQVEADPLEIDYTAPK